MLRIVAGDETAFEILVRRHEDRVYALAYRVLGNGAEARDVAQEVFIKLWENPRAWKSVRRPSVGQAFPPALFTTWLYRVTLNRALNRQRMLKLKRWISLKNADVDADADADGQFVDDRPAPDEELIRREEAEHLNRAFQALNSRQKAALHLRYRENLSVKEVAQALGVSAKSAESLIFRGKQGLREMINGGKGKVHDGAEGPKKRQTS
jgi:RNA polymerase sigma-70 factor (ECF subfamily)